MMSLAPLSPTQEIVSALMPTQGAVSALPTREIVSALMPTQDIVSALMITAFSEAMPMSTLGILAVGLLAAVLALFIPILWTRSRRDEAQLQTVPDTNISATVYSSAASSRKAS